MLSGPDHRFFATERALDGARRDASRASLFACEQGVQPRDGINGGQRVLSIIKDADDIVFVSSQVRERIREMYTGDKEFKKRLENLYNRGRRKAKHGQMWRVYELNHTSLCEQEVLTVLRDMKLVPSG